MKRWLVIRFDRNNQPIATADFANELDAREAFDDFTRFSGQTAGGVNLLSPNGFILARHLYGEEVS